MQGSRARMMYNVPLHAGCDAHKLNFLCFWQRVPTVVGLRAAAIVDISEALASFLKTQETTPGISEAQRGLLFQFAVTASRRTRIKKLLVKAPAAETLSCEAVIGVPQRLHHLNWSHCNWEKVETTPRRGRAADELRRAERCRALGSARRAARAVALHPSHALGQTTHGTAPYYSQPKP